MSANETDCYLVTVQAKDLSQSTCIDLQGGVVTAVSNLNGQYAAGAAISIDVKQGSARTIGVWAFKSATGTCDTGVSISPSKYSAPLLIGTTTIDVAGSSVTAEINANFSGAK